MDELIEFLNARVAEDAEVAQATRKNEQRVPGTDRWFASHSNAITSMAPHRAVAEVEAKRRIVRELSTVTEWNWPSQPDGSVPMEYVDALRHILRLLALPYADHPDYRDEWRP